MTAVDKSNVIQLINYYSALADRSHKVSRKPGLATAMACYSSGRSDTLHEVCDHLKQLIECGDVEV